MQITYPRVFFGHLEAWLNYANNVRGGIISVPDLKFKLGSSQDLSEVFDTDEVGEAQGKWGRTVWFFRGSKGAKLTS